MQLGGDAMKQISWFFFSSGVYHLKGGVLWYLEQYTWGFCSNCNYLLVVVAHSDFCSATLTAAFIERHRGDVNRVLTRLKMLGYRFLGGHRARRFFIQPNVASEETLNDVGTLPGLSGCVWWHAVLGGLWGRGLLGVVLRPHWRFCGDINGHQPNSVMSVRKDALFGINRGYTGLVWGHQLGGERKNFQQSGPFETHIWILCQHKPWCSYTFVDYCKCEEHFWLLGNI